jgi:hypothetical protein
MYAAAALSDLPEALQQRWDGACGSVDDILAGLGRPQDLALTLRLPRRRRALARDWLGYVESLVRRVLLLIALALKDVLSRDALATLIRLRSDSRAAQRNSARRLYDIADPATWTARLRFTAPRYSASGGGASRRTRRDPYDDSAPYQIWRPDHDERLDDPFYTHFAPEPAEAPHAARQSARPASGLIRRAAETLAHRLEAVRRASEHPIAHALRLLRLLLRDRTRRRTLLGVLKPPAQSNLDRWHDALTPLQHTCVKTIIGDTS